MGEVHQGLCTRRAEDRVQGACCEPAARSHRYVVQRCERASAEKEDPGMEDRNPCREMAQLRNRG